MPDNLKRKTLAFLCLAVLLTALIAAALPQLDLSSGIPLPFTQGQAGALPADQSPQTTISISTFLKALLETTLVLVVAVVLFKARKGLPWKQFLLPALIVGLLTILVLYFLFALLDVHINFDLSMPEILPPAVDIHVPLLGSPPPACSG